MMFSLLKSVKVSPIKSTQNVYMIQIIITINIWACVSISSCHMTWEAYKQLSYDLESIRNWKQQTVLPPKNLKIWIILLQEEKCKEVRQMLVGTKEKQEKDNDFLKKTLIFLFLSLPSSFLREFCLSFIHSGNIYWAPAPCQAIHNLIC